MINPVFQIIKEAITKDEKNKKTYFEGSEGGRLPHWKALKLISECHTFLFDRKSIVWTMKNVLINQHKSIPELVENLSLPFEKSLFLSQTPSSRIYSPEIIRKLRHQVDPTEILKELAIFQDRAINQKLGKDEQAFKQYVWGMCVNEITPEHISLITFSEIYDYHSSKRMGSLVEYIDNILIADKAYLNDIFTLSKAINTKKIGVEHINLTWRASIQKQSRTFRMPVIYHIAGKQEYDKVTPVNPREKIDWKQAGYWRGHWRAFYLYNGTNKVKDELGRNVVNYKRIGKNRYGKYSVSGYTWVSEHSRGDPELAKLSKKEHFVTSSEEE